MGPRWKTYKRGIGPHPENAAVAAAMSNTTLSFQTRVPYPNHRLRRCDLVLGDRPPWDWAIEVKMWRLFGDNGKQNDNIFMHVLSPYDTHRSALTDCTKLANAGFQCRLAVLIFGYEHNGFPMAPVMEEFEAAVRRRHGLVGPYVFGFSKLVHPVFSRGAVYGWELTRESAK